MNKKKTSVVLAIVFFMTTIIIPPVGKDKLVYAETVSVRTIENNVELQDIKIKSAYERMMEDLVQLAAEREYNERVAQRDAEVVRITESNNRKNNVHFNPENLLSTSNITVEELNAIFNIKGKPLMIEVSQAFVDAEQAYGINALFLAGLVAQESYWAEIPAGNGDNLTGMGVYSPQHTGFTYGGSRYRNIMATAEAIKNNYLTPGGAYYYGLATTDVNVKYCLKAYSPETDYEWSANINSIASDLNYIYHNNVKVMEEIPAEVSFSAVFEKVSNEIWEEKNIWRRE